MAIDSERWAPATFSGGSSRARRIIQADMPATAKAVVKYAAMTMWAKRFGKDGLKTIRHQSTGTAMPFSMAWPAGVCIQELADRIQKAEKSVPSATMQVAKKCSRSP